MKLDREISLTDRGKGFTIEGPYGLLGVYLHLSIVVGAYSCRVAGQTT